MKYQVWSNKQKEIYYILQNKKFLFHLGYDINMEMFIVCHKDNKYYHRTTEFLYNKESVKHYPKYIKEQVFYLYTYMVKDNPLEIIMK